jgi:recombinational DNA repair protein RecR
MACQNIKRNMQYCNCTGSCDKKGTCCDCLENHRSKGQLPACYFPNDIEAGYDRSIDNFIKVVQERGYDYLKA